ncbi:ribosomal maturation YjgA family protein [Actinoplanes derwentensis]|uniref:DUF2809 domain-containing protein n=1 Tax=Actinoplanes derwentensis TaxID=113562 RepID=A0A1H2CJ16_9ACTN|nr:DUF2809 domain-containing protein [Actinoplanes derwentensis]GID88704.1 hypothetical protein Ade03nite_76280 [Actinoplanes derwentensis]SDT70046.1 Protein of unknown function [Actinoplanes derwentensis]
MSINLRSRLAWLGAAAGFLAVALVIRAIVPLGSPVEQVSGTALYASMVYAGVLFLVPGLTPYRAGGLALLWCWGAELFQLTGIPAVLSAQSLLARLVLGAAFDPLDLLWYPLGVIPLVAAHRLLRNN